MKRAVFEIGITYYYAMPESKSLPVERYIRRGGNLHIIRNRKRQHNTSAWSTTTTFEHYNVILWADNMVLITIIAIAISARKPPIVSRRRQSVVVRRPVCAFSRRAISRKPVSLKTNTTPWRRRGQNQ